MNVFGQISLSIALAFIASITAYFVVSRFLSNNARAQRWEAIGQALLLKWGDRIFVGIVLGYVFVFASLALLRYLTFHTGYTERGIAFSSSWDLGQYSQIIWNSMQGRLFENSYILDSNSFLGKTFSPILLAFVPLYAVWSDPIVLLSVQVLAVAVGGFPVYWFARAQLGRPLALVVGLTFYLSPAVETIVLTEFHEIVLAVPLLSFATLFLLRRNYKPFLVCLGLASLVKEEIAFITIALGMFIFLFQRKRGLGLALSALGAIWGMLLLQYVIPFFRGAEYGSAFYYFGQGTIGGGGSRYSYLGSGLTEMLTTVLTRPDIVLQHVLVPDKVEYLLQLIVPLAFVPLVGAEMMLLTLPTLGYSLLSNYALQSSIRSYYFSPLLPFLFFALVVGVRRLLQVSAGMDPASRTNSNVAHGSTAGKIALSVLLLTASGSSYMMQGPGPLGQYFEAERYRLDEHAIFGLQLARSIPGGVTVVAQNEYLAHLSDRKRIYEIPIPDYRQVDYLLADKSRFWYGVHRAYWEDYLATGYFEIVTEKDGFVLAKRLEPGVPLKIRFADKMTLLAYTMVPDDQFQGGQTLRPIVGWRSEQDIGERYIVDVHLVDQYGHIWKTDNREPQNGAMPTSKWIKGQYIQDQYSLPLDHAMPTGEYRIIVRVFNPQTQQYLDARDESGNSLGIEPTVTTVHINKSKANLAASQEAIEHRILVDMKEIRLIGFDLPETARVGRILPVGLFWKARARPAQDYLVAVQLLDADGRVAVEQAAQPAAGIYPTTRWDSGEILLDWHDLALPNELGKGSYQLRVVLRDAESNAELAQAIITTIAVQD